MELIRTIREKQQTRRQADIRQQAECTIHLSDFAGSLYIAFNEVPLIEIEEEWTSRQIVEKLSDLRNNYILSKMKECGLS